MRTLSASIKDRILGELAEPALAAEAKRRAEEAQALWKQLQEHRRDAAARLATLLEANRASWERYDAAMKALAEARAAWAETNAQVGGAEAAAEGAEAKLLSRLAGHLPGWTGALLRALGRKYEEILN